MPSPLEGLFDPPPAAGAEKPAAAGHDSPLSAALGAMQRNGGLFGVLQQLEKAGAGEVAQALLAGGLGSLDTARNPGNPPDGKPQP
jgi:uncharacterized protein YidB (DUF937 family)